ncbi:reverse transcriptase [Gossypium australe]|uniref:Reverse transcriptase n=1 Tax=Gossypium australe TaxID=47621 RepID=A0A5B6WU65_9ROSI|nr:reverse transcriptase [Gossypium australe]
MLRRLGREQVTPWLFCGDFNEILYSFEKERGLPRDEAWWTMETSCEEEVKRWEIRITKLRKGLSRKLLARIKELDRIERTDKNLAGLIDTKIHLNLEIEKEERYWEQQERMNWLKQGDKNTKIFHNLASQ